MRNAFATELVSIASDDERVVLLSGDIGNRLFNDFKLRFSGRFFNCGVAEASMTGIAAGMAMSGIRPITYSITPFVTTRCLEQIRIDICYQNGPVIIVGVGAGLSYAGLGATHQSCEDIAFLRMLPNMTVICPGDPVEVGLALRSAVAHGGPVYIRLGKKGEPIVYSEIPEFRIGKGIVITEGDDVCLLSTGNMLPVAVQSGKGLEAKGLSTSVVSLHTVKPLDEALLADVFQRFRVVATVEEHSVLGGLGSAVAEWMSEQSHIQARLCRIGTDDRFLHEAGGQEHAREHFGLTPDAVATRVLEACS